MRDETRTRPMLDEIVGDKGNQWRHAKIDFVPETSAAVSGKDSRCSIVKKKAFVGTIHFYCNKLKLNRQEISFIVQTVTKMLML